MQQPLSSSSWCFYMFFVLWCYSFFKTSLLVSLYYLKSVKYANAERALGEIEIPNSYFSACSIHKCENHFSWKGIIGFLSLLREYSHIFSIVLCYSIKLFSSKIEIENIMKYTCLIQKIRRYLLTSTCAYFLFVDL